MIGEDRGSNFGRELSSSYASDEAKNWPPKPVISFIKPTQSYYKSSHFTLKWLIMIVLHMYFDILSVGVTDKLI